MTGTGSTDDDLAALRERAAHAPTPEQVRAMADVALAKGSEQMSPEDFAALAHEAVGQAEQVVVLLRRLAAMTLEDR